MSEFYPLDRDFIYKNIGISAEKVHIFDTIGSTNTQMKQYAEMGAEEFELVIANSQHAGRGRVGRQFFSPSGCGIYLSLLLHPNFSPMHANRITTCAAVAGCMAIKRAFGIEALIKWVNDLYIGGKKIGGILTEGSIDPQSGLLRYAVLGIGINVFTPHCGFPHELDSIAGALFAEGAKGLKREILAVEFVRAMTELYPQINNGTYLYEKYSKSMFLCGMEVDVLSHCGNEKRSALVIGVNTDFSLKVRYDDMTEQDVFDGEVSLKIRR